MSTDQASTPTRSRVGLTLPSAEQRAIVRRVLAEKKIDEAEDTAQAAFNSSI